MAALTKRNELRHEYTARYVHVPPPNQNAVYVRMSGSSFLTAASRSSVQEAKLLLWRQPIMLRNPLAYEVENNCLLRFTMEHFSNLARLIQLYY